MVIKSRVEGKNVKIIYEDTEKLIVEKPAVTIIGRIFCSITAISSSVSPTAAAASFVKTIVPGKPNKAVNPTAMDKAAE